MVWLELSMWQDGKRTIETIEFMWSSCWNKNSKRKCNGEMICELSEIRLWLLSRDESVGQRKRYWMKIDRPLNEENTYVRYDSSRLHWGSLWVWVVLRPSCTCQLAARHERPGCWRSEGARDLAFPTSANDVVRMARTPCGPKPAAPHLAPSITLELGALRWRSRPIAR